VSMGCIEKTLRVIQLVIFRARSFFLIRVVLLETISLHENAQSKLMIT
jgi:hypothetical protein